MGKKIYLFGLFILTIFLAQSCAVSGIKTGVNGESYRDPVGLQAGVLVPVANLSDAMSIIAEANISMQGAKWEELNLKGRTNLLYVNAPLVVRYQTKKGIFGEAGLQPGFLLRAKDKYEDITDNYMDHMNKFDLSIPIGIGYQFKNNIGVRFRVIPGITDITRDDEYGDENNRNFVVGLGVIYTLKKN